MDSLYDKNIEDLMKMLNNPSRNEFEIPKISAVLISKSMMKSAELISSLNKPISNLQHTTKNAIDRINERADKMIASSNKAFVMSIIFSIIMSLLTGAIAFSAVVQLLK